MILYSNGTICFQILLDTKRIGIDLFIRTSNTEIIEQHGMDMFNHLN